MPLTVESSVRKDVKIFKPLGTLDINTSRDFDKVFETERQSFTKIAVDMEEVDFIDSSGIGQLVKMLHWVRQKNGEIFIFGLSDKNNTIFQNDKLNMFLQTMSTKEFNRKFPPVDGLEDLLKRA